MKKIGSPDIERIRSTVEALAGEYYLPGITVGVVSGDELAPWA